MKTSTRLLALALLAATTTIASAQPEPMPIDSELPPPPAPEPQPPPPPPRPPQPPQPPPQPPAAAPAEAPTTGRPVGLAIGIGVGYVFPTSLETPNTTSARLRLVSGLIFEPILTIATARVSRDDGTTDEEDETNELTLATGVRLPIVRRGKVELELLGSVGVTTVTDDPDGPDNATTTTTLFLGWGVGITYWLNQHWALSVSARNPLVSYSKVSRDLPPPISAEMSTSTTTIGAIFDPTVAVMMHLFN